MFRWFTRLFSKKQPENKSPAPKYTTLPPARPATNTACSSTSATPDPYPAPLFIQPYVYDAGGSHHHDSGGHGDSGGGDCGGCDGGGGGGGD